VNQIRAPIRPKEYVVSSSAHAFVPSPDSSSTLPVKVLSFEERVHALGKKLLAGVRVESSSVLSRQYWSQQFMQWSMTNPTLKRNMFRLVDVLPSLTSAQSISDHVHQYLGDDIHALPSILGWGLKTSKLLPAPLLATAVRLGVKQMASQFIAGESPKQALSVLRTLRKNKLAFTVDLLGEYCVSEREALAYLDRYRECFTVLGNRVPQWPESAPIIAGHPGEASATCVSVKLSALYSQTASLNAERSIRVLSDRLAILASQAKEIGAQLYVDAEDSATNELVYGAFERVFTSSEFRSMPYVGCVVQAYAKESLGLLHRLHEIAHTRGAPLAVRLVKGAYWDQETTGAIQQGWDSPLFAKKRHSDANYELLSRYLIDNHSLLFPAFGSHNIRSIAHACTYAESKGLTTSNYELQMLYGMADPIARALRAEGALVRMYVPLGPVLPGMGYLVRRLLENTSNDSFLRHTFFEEHEVDSLLCSPLTNSEELV
jgi:RHH-type proline utilization regulon transcriptional repressor/proline dehydrogenase/delta 1-pyrroline-5-carboxylate dehydrogenase